MSQIEESQRNTGRTTRLVDQYIQEFFEKGEVIVRDHEDRSAHHLRCTYLILRRLKLEHPQIKVECNGSKRLITRVY